MIRPGFSLPLFMLSFTTLSACDVQEDRAVDTAFEVDAADLKRSPDEIDGMDDASNLNGGIDLDLGLEVGGSGAVASADDVLMTCSGSDSDSYSATFGPSSTYKAKGSLSISASGGFHTCQINYSATLTNDHPTGRTPSMTALRGDLYAGGVDTANWIAGHRYSLTSDYTLSRSGAVAAICGWNDVAVDTLHTIVDGSSYNRSEDLIGSVYITCCTRAGECY